ncbi:hypothetical protein [Azotosporobacter soli]|uniref:hypothetical protein n=1 Tax=Azotosporobacter soli TaxID=3055040 RepID=UPI0031FE648F
MEEKLTAKQGLVIGSIVTPIGLHLKYPWNVALAIIASVVFLLVMIRDRKTYNKYNFIGTMIMIAAGLLAAMVMSGNPIAGASELLQIAVSLVTLFIGIFTIGIGNHIKDPNRVTKKTLAYAFGGFCFCVICVGAVVWFAYSLHH